MDWLNTHYLWTLLGVPTAVLLFVWAAWKRHNAYQLFGERSLVSRLARTVSNRKRRWKASIVVLGLFFLALALAGPRFGTKIKEVKREGIDLVVALDVSLSMTAEDVAPNRLTRAKNEIKKLLDDLQGDRVGLVIFAGDAFIQCPLTSDYGAVRLFLDVASPSMIATPGTDFGAALRMANQAFEGGLEGDSESEERPTRVMLVVSDGENHVADLDDIKEEARDAGVVLFAAGVGEDLGVPIPIYRNGRRVDYKKDGVGRVVSTRLEELSLKSLSEGGAYFRIARTSSSLSKIISEIDRLEKAEYGAEEFEEYDEKYQWPLALALLLLLVEPMVSYRSSQSTPSDEVEE